MTNSRRRRTFCKLTKNKPEVPRTKWQLRQVKTTRYIVQNIRYWICRNSSYVTWCEKHQTWLYIGRVENPLSGPYKTALETELVANMKHHIVMYGIRIDHLTNVMIFYIQVLRVGLRDLYENMYFKPFRTYESKTWTRKKNRI